MPSQCLANHRERSISAPLSKKTRRTDQSDSLGFKSDSLLVSFPEQARDSKQRTELSLLASPTSGGGESCAARSFWMPLLASATSRGRSPPPPHAWGGLGRG
ncbi:conserved hypothetical protein [Thiomonas sp. X19]|nr:conserved hypothetical protein [Thiomonas sp. X19]